MRVPHLIKHIKKLFEACARGICDNYNADEKSQKFNSSFNGNKDDYKSESSSSRSNKTDSVKSYPNRNSNSFSNIYSTKKEQNANYSDKFVKKKKSKFSLKLNG